MMKLVAKSLAQPNSSLLREFRLGVSLFNLHGFK